MSLSRRSFLRGTSSAFGLAVAAAGMSRFSILERVAHAAVPTDYRALVGVLLAGGNDANNMVIPYDYVPSTGDPNPFDTYVARRGALALAGDKAGAATVFAETRITPTGMVADAFALHPAMAKLTNLFNTDKKLAIVFNVGPMVGPTALANFSDPTKVPENLFSHRDQQAAWSSAVADPGYYTSQGGSVNVRTGWGGRAADLVVANGLAPTLPNSTEYYPPITWYGGDGVFGAGVQRQPLSIAADGSLALTMANAGSSTRAIRQNSLMQMGSLTNDDNALVSTFAHSFGVAQANAALRSAAITAIPQTALDAVNTWFDKPTAASAASVTQIPIKQTTLGAQLYHILIDMIAGALDTASGGLGQSRQIFSASLGGFDTHANQLTTQASLLGQVDDAFDAFHRAVAAVNAAGVAGMKPINATLFTMSDFGRALTPNASGGSDHGWGGHMLVLGDMVDGGRAFGKLPDLRDSSSGGTSDVGEGRWLPTISSDRYENTLAYWFGITELVDRDYLFPRISKFASDVVGSKTTIKYGFMKK